MSERQTALRDRFLRQFERIYVINLAHRTDRRRQIERQLRKLGLSFSDPQVILFEAIRPESKGKWPSIGTLGCFMSHLHALKRADDDGVGSVLILEDDTDWSDGFLKHADAVLDEIEVLDWDVLHGGVEDGNERPRLQRLSWEDRLILTNFIAFRGTLLADIVAHLTALSEREMGDPRGGPMHVDGAYNWFRKDRPAVETYISTPALARQRPSRTDIHDLGWSDRAPVVSSVKNALRPALYGLRKAFTRLR